MATGSSGVLVFTRTQVLRPLKRREMNLSFKVCTPKDTENRFPEDGPSRASEKVDNTRRITTHICKPSPCLFWKISWSLMPISSEVHCQMWLIWLLQTLVRPLPTPALTVRRGLDGSS